ncbi:MAG: hypothetical protein WCI03_08310 [bacterium]
MSNTRRFTRVAVGMAILICITLIGLVISGHFHVPFVVKQTGWSIGIYSGSSPTQFIPMSGVHNPVLTAADVTDISADYVADPFMVDEGGRWYLFFEVKNAATRQGDIGLATSPDAVHWSYDRIVLNEPFHLSYPYVFKWKKRYYMVPESNQASSVRLYEATKFPAQWKYVTNLLSDVQYADSSLFRYNDTWWLFTSTTNHDNMFAYYAADLTGPWHPHTNNPLISNNPTAARPGGRIQVDRGKIYRYAQVDTPSYGYGLRSFEITELTPTSFHEVEVLDFKNLMATGNRWSWNGIGMHTIDPHRLGENRWIACVDGMGSILKFGRENYGTDAGKREPEMSAEH